MEKLELQSDYELFWGDADDKDFVEAIFVNLITDILDKSDWDEAYWNEPFWNKTLKELI